MRTRYLSVAHDEIREAADYYNAISPGLGTEFKHELRQLLRRVAAMPMAWPNCGPGTRKCLLTRFPYLVIYAPLPNEILVLAVGHQHRNPGFWRQRTQNA